MTDDEKQRLDELERRVAAIEAELHPEREGDALALSTELFRVANRAKAQATRRG